MDTKYTIDLQSLPVGCRNCHFVTFCQPGNKRRPGSPSPAKFTVKTRKYERGEHLFRVNEAFKNFYVIRSGSVKTYSFVQTGMEQVTGFHLAGNLLGLNVIGCERHTESAVALELSSICEIAVSRLEAFRKENPHLQQLLWYAMSNEIRDEHEHLRLLSRTSAGARLSGFLLNLSTHLQRRGYSATNFNLSLSRHDIANLLGLAVETVSRLFTHFQEEGLVTVKRKHIVLDDMDGLKRLASANDDLARLASRQRVTQNVYARPQQKMT